MRQSNMSGNMSGLGTLTYATTQIKETHGDMREIEGQLQRVENWISEAESGLANMETRLAVVLQPTLPATGTGTEVSPIKSCMQSSMGMRLQALADRLEAHALAIASIQHRSCV